MANTPARGVRVDDELWAAATEAAAGNRETVTDVIKRALLDYARKNGTLR